MKILKKVKSSSSVTVHRNSPKRHHQVKVFMFVAFCLFVMLSNFRVDFHALITNKGIRIVALDLTTSHQFLGVDRDDFTGRLFSVVNGMVLDMLAAVTRKDYEDRRRRQLKGIEKARPEKNKEKKIRGKSSLYSTFRST